jgi:Flp pilus assembly protein TadB
MLAAGGLFLFLAAGAVALFAFLSVAAWTGTQAAERKDRDRFALLKTLAENPADNAQRVLELLREQEERERTRKEREERRGYLVGGAVLLACGTGLSVMVTTLGDKAGMWTIGLIPILIGLVLVSTGLLTKPTR